MVDLGGHYATTPTPATRTAIPGAETPTVAAAGHAATRGTDRSHGPNQTALAFFGADEWRTEPHLRAGMTPGAPFSFVIF